MAFALADVYVDVDVDVDFVMPAPGTGARKVFLLELERVGGGASDRRDLSRLREGEEARREAREWVDGAGWGGG